MIRYSSCYLYCTVLLVACSEGYLHKVYMKMLWTLCIIAVKGPMGVNCKDIVDDRVEFRYVEMLVYAKFLKYLLVFVYCWPYFIHFFQRTFYVNLKMGILYKMKSTIVQTAWMTCSSTVPMITSKKTFSIFLNLLPVYCNIKDIPSLKWWREGCLSKLLI